MTMRTLLILACSAISLQASAQVPAKADSALVPNDSIRVAH